MGTPNRFSSIMSDRIHAILGEPPSHKNWLTKIYQMRSKIVHGDVPSIRVGCQGYNTIEYMIKKYELASNRGITVIIAILQDLIETNSKRYVFPTRVQRERI